MNSKCGRSAHARAREVHVRVAAEADAVYIDLANADWHAVRVTAVGWSMVQNPPVQFRRSSGMQPLPFAERGVAIDQLRSFLNVTACDFTLVVAYLLAAYPYLKKAGSALADYVHGSVARQVDGIFIVQSNCPRTSMPLP